MPCGARMRANSHPSRRMVTLKSLFMKVKKESEKVGLKLNFKKTKTMESDLITSWQIDRETVETFFSWVLKSLQMVTAAMKLQDSCSLEEKL